jgi:AcrR family transcriptional regulator
MTIVMKKTDPRVVRTRQMLRDALIALVLERGYDGINIQAITDRAGLRRATFYLHYRDKEDLLMHMMRETVDDLTHQMEGLMEDPLTPEAQLNEQVLTFRHVQARADLYRALLSGQGAARVTRDLRDYLAERIRQKCIAGQSQAALPVEVMANYLAAVKLNMIIWWLDKGMPYPPEEMAAMSAHLVQFGINSLLQPAGAA